MSSMGIHIKTDILDKARKIYVVTIRGELDAHTFEQLQNVLEDLIEQDVFNIILDMSDVSYVSSAGLGVIAASHAEVIGNGGRLALVGLSEEVLNVFDTMGMLGMLVIEPDRQSALKNFA